MKTKGLKGFLTILILLIVVVSATATIASATGSTTYKVTFTETGLPAGTKWYVNLSTGQSFSSTNNTVIFNEPNGSYGYGIASSNKNYAPSSYSGTFTVNNANVSVAITFNRVYVISVNENGLPSTITYYFNVTNAKYSAHVAGNFTFTLPNGTYNFTVVSTNKIYAPIPSAGTFTVNGKNMSIEITFKLITYKVTFTETGLPLGIKWYLNMSNEQSFIVSGNFTFSETNGTYSYTIASSNKDYAPSSYTGSFTVNGANVNVPITFKIITNKITFTESGLPTGTIWYVNLSNGQSFSSTTNTIAFNETNGTYTYKIIVNKIYAPSPYTGSFTVNGANVNIAITFKLITYKVTFIETGLPTGTKWYTNLSNGELASSNESLISFNIPNGTYNYTIFNTNNNYKPISLNGIFTVNGKNLTINLTFTKITNTTSSTTTGSSTTGGGFFNLPNSSISISDITIIFIVIVIVLLILASVYKENKENKKTKKRWR